MYLKRMEMQGFKSFADKTVIELKQGITTVIVNNIAKITNIIFDGLEKYVFNAFNIFPNLDNSSLFLPSGVLFSSKDNVSFIFTPYLR